MTVERLPPVGVFLRPVGAHDWYMYCMQVVKVLAAAESGERVDYLECMRWGLSDDKQPEDDGHLKMNYYRANVRPVGAGVAYRFEENSPLRFDPVYWKRIETRGQQDLFV